MVAVLLPPPATIPNAAELPLVRAVHGHQLPTLGQVARRVVPQAIEASIVPAVLILVLGNLVSATIAIVGALAWTVLAAVRRWATRRRIPGLSVLATTRLVLRSLISLAAGSTFVYFLQGSIGGYGSASAFLVSVVVDRPLARRFADDFCDLPAPTLEHHRVRRALRRMSLMWGLVGLVHATVGLWLLLNLSVNAYVVTNTFLSVAVPVALIAISVAWFRRTVRSQLQERRGVPR